ncbi:MAG: hypothetical protein ACT4OI_03210, partial [Methanobacteriota archaeon]
NQPGFQFCTNCGSALTAAPPMAVPPAAAPGAPPAFGAPPMYGAPTAPMPFVYGPPPWEMERRKQVDRTKTGILLLLIGVLLAWIPVIQLIGYLLILIGTILVFAGRKAFQAPHPRNAGLSMGLVITGIIGFVAVFVVFFIVLLASISTTDPTTAVTAAVNALNVLLVGLIVVVAIFGLALVYATYSLQPPMGRIVLWAAFGAGLGVQVAIFAIVASAIGPILSGVISTGTLAEVEALQARANLFGFLSIVSDVLFAVGYYLAWSRINRGEIPAPAPATPSAIPPAAPPVQPI